MKILLSFTYPIRIATVNVEVFCHGAKITVSGLVNTYLSLNLNIYDCVQMIPHSHSGRGKIEYGWW